MAWYAAPLARAERPGDSARVLDALAHQLAGRFLAFDGPDGSGKSTQIAKFVDWCRGEGLAVQCVREPGGTSIGEEIRTILLDPANADMDVVCEMLLYMASRAQLVAQVVRPARERGELVVADRFVSATLAYQGTAGGLSMECIQAVAEVAVGDCWPDLTLILDVDDDVAAGRVGADPDRMEQKGPEFQRRVRAGFLEQAILWPQRYRVVDASGAAQTVFGRVLEAVSDFVQGAASGQLRGRKGKKCQ